jgi:hypothetical protein
MKLSGHAEYMEVKTNEYNYFNQNSYKETRQHWKQWQRMDDNIKMDVKEIGCKVVDRIQAENRAQSVAGCCEDVDDPSETQKSRSFLTS